MRAGPYLGALVVLADQVSGRPEPLEVLRLERRLAIRRRQPGVRVPPSLALEGLPTLAERVGRGHRAFHREYARRLALPEIRILDTRAVLQHCPSPLRVRRLGAGSRDG